MAAERNGVWGRAIEVPGPGAGLSRAAEEADAGVAARAPSAGGAAGASSADPSLVLARSPPSLCQTERHARPADARAQPGNRPALYLPPDAGSVLVAARTTRRRHRWHCVGSRPGSSNSDGSPAMRGMTSSPCLRAAARRGIARMAVACAASTRSRRLSAGDVTRRQLEHAADDPVRPAGQPAADRPRHDQRPDDARGDVAAYGRHHHGSPR